MSHPMEDAVAMYRSDVERARRDRIPISCAWTADLRCDLCRGTGLSPIRGVCLCVESCREDTQR